MPPARPSATLILPSEGYRIADLLDAASRLGVDVAVATDAHHGLAEDMGAQLIPIDFEDESGAARRIAGSSWATDAIIALDDRGVNIAAMAADLRGLPHNPADAVRATRDKILARRRLDGIVAQPRFQILESSDDAGAVVASFDGPVVMKPAGLAGSIGVIRIDSPPGAHAAAASIRAIQTQHGYPTDNPLLIESYIDGPEVSIEGLLTGGDWDTLAIFDKPDSPTGPHFPETIYVTPTRLAKATVESIEATARRAAAHLGLIRGAVHAEFRIEDGAVVLLELAARPIGGLCGRALRFGLGDTSLEEVLIRNALGERVRGTRLAPGASGVSMIPVPGPGIFQGINGVEAASAVEHVTDIAVGKMTGAVVQPLPHDSTYLGFVFARAPGPVEVEHALRSAVEWLEVHIDSPPLSSPEP